MSGLCSPCSSLLSGLSCYTSLPQVNLLCVCVCVCLCAHAICVCVCVLVHACMCVCAHVCTRVRVCTRARVCVSVFIGRGKCLTMNLCLLISCVLMLVFNLSMKWTCLVIIWERALEDPTVIIIRWTRVWMRLGYISSAYFDSRDIVFASWSSVVLNICSKICIVQASCCFKTYLPINIESCILLVNVWSAETS